jgi:hypothetical protein
MVAFLFPRRLSFTTLGPNAAGSKDDDPTLKNTLTDALC